MGKLLNKANRDYIASLIPKDIPNWKEVWQKGYEEGKKIEIMHTPFEDKYGMKPVDYRLKLKEEGKICWKINTGLATIDDQVNALKEAEKFNQETGLNISMAHQLPQNISGVPKDKREGLPISLGFMLNEPEDWIRIAQASPVVPVFGDNHVGWPNAVETTINSVHAGSQWTGLFGMYVQVAPGCPDEVWNMTQNVEALGIIASKYDDKVIVNTQTDDSYGAYFNDLATSLAWAMMDRHIVSDLCGARISFSFGNFTQNIQHKAALWLAAAEVFNKDDQPGIGFIYPDTISHWDHHIHANYGFQIPEILFMILAEKHFKAGLAWLSVPITEKVAIPTVPEMLDMTGACQRAQEVTYYWEDMIDWRPLEKLRDQTIELGTKMYNYMIQGLQEAGVNTDDPIELQCVLKAIDPFVLERLFHPSVVDDGAETVVPLMPAALWNATQNELANQINLLKDKEVAKAIKGHRVCVASADVHFAGAAVIVGVMKEFGADVVDGGNQLEAIDVLDLADENGITDICVSLHNGQALPYARLIVKLAAERNKKYRFFFGGVLQSFLNEDDDVPSDVTKEIQELGIETVLTVEELLEKIVK